MKTASKADEPPGLLTDLALMNKEKKEAKKRKVLSRG
jgi:hypothetical protein